MNKLLAVIVCCAVMAMSVIGNDEKFTTKYDNMNLDEVLKNDRLINKYVQCVMETGSCTPDGELLKGECFHFFIYILSIALLTFSIC